jgi:hypothetical protein
MFDFLVLYPHIPDHCLGLRVQWHGFLCYFEFRFRLGVLSKDIGMMNLS